MIKLKFEKTYRTERYGELCSVAIPFPKGTLFDSGKIIILKEGIVFPSQTKVTSYWEDKSVRWLFVRFLADLPVNSDSEYYLSYEGVITEGYNGYKTISCTKDGDGYTIDTGVLRVTMQPGKYSGFKECFVFSSKYYLGNFYGPVLIDDSGKTSELEIASFHVVEEGAVCVILEGVAFHQLGKCSCLVRIRVTAYADSPILDLSYRLFNTSEEELRIRSITFGFRSPEKAIRTCAAISNYNTNYDIGENGEAVEKNVNAEYLLYDENEHIPEVLYGTMFADCNSNRGGVCVTVYQAHQNFPKSVYADEDGLMIELVPEESNGVVMQPGMSREQRFMLHFHDVRTELKELNDASLIYQMPDRPILEPLVYQEAGVFPDIFVENKKPEVETLLIHKADAHSRCFGMMNWGDSPEYLYMAQGSGELVWTNNEYDFPHACACQYVRTGLRRFLDYMLVSGRHLIDVDVCHFNDDPLLLGGQWKHSRGHVIDSKIVLSHQWVEGLLDYYHFTGDEEAYQTAVGIGENIIRLLNTTKFQRKGENNEGETDQALRSLVALYLETHEERFLSKCDWIVSHFENWEKESGHWLSPYTDNTSIRVVLMISSTVVSLMRYYRIDPQTRMKDMILRSVDDLIKHCYSKDCQLFIYKELPGFNCIGNNVLVLEALVIAYELTGNLKYLEYGKMTFELALKETYSHYGGMKKIVGDALIGSGSGTKDFAQSYFPLVTYYKAVVDNHLI